MATRRRTVREAARSLLAKNQRATRRMLSRASKSAGDRFRVRRERHRPVGASVRPGQLSLRRDRQRCSPMRVDRPVALRRQRRTRPGHQVLRRRKRTDIVRQSACLRRAEMVRCPDAQNAVHRGSHSSERVPRCGNNLHHTKHGIESPRYPRQRTPNPSRQSPISASNSADSRAGRRSSRSG
jgi:hypothetical protein